MKKENNELLAGLPMPRPLADPLLLLRKVFKILLLLQMAMGSIFLIAGIAQKQYELLYLAGQILMGALFVLALFVLAVPKIRTNAIYLRSFSKDTESKKIREHIEVALGKDYRLSGIRDPRKRMPYILRPLFITVMMLKYAGARFLNLEAGSDWFARLWVSIAGARVLFIDLRDITEFVKNEILLSAKCMKLERIIFIADSSKTMDEWQQVIAETLSLPVDKKKALHIMLWDKDKATQFVKDVGVLIQDIPLEPAGLNWSAFDLIKKHIKTKNQVLKERVSAIVHVTVGLVIINYIVFKIDTAGSAIVFIFFAAAVIFLVYIIFLSVFAMRGKYRKKNLAKFYNTDYEKVLAKEIKLSYFILIMFFASLLLMVYGFLFSKVELYSNEARVVSAQATIYVLEEAAQLYQIDNGHYLSETDGLEALVPNYINALPVDPWGTPYRYILRNDIVVIKSNGKDKLPDTGDDVFSSD